MALPEDLETVNREVLLSGEGVQAARLLMAPAIPTPTKVG